MKFNLLIDNPEKNIGPGELDISDDGHASFFCVNGINLIAEMRRTKLECAHANIMVLTGFESTGSFDKLGKAIYRHQKWILSEYAA